MSQPELGIPFYLDELDLPTQVAVLRFNAFAQALETLENGAEKQPYSDLPIVIDLLAYNIP